MDAGMELEEILQAEQAQQFEMEFLSGEENDLPKRKTACAKNPNHEGFVGVEEFGLQHFPERYQDSDLVEMVLARANVTVRAVVSYTSKARPAGYSCHRLRGIHGLRRFGSGWIECVLGATNDGEDCPCPKCAESSSPVKKWGQVMINTATHVVFDTEEARNTTFDLFYNSEDSKATIRSLSGFRIQSRNIVTDHSLVACVTHDLELLTKLKDMFTHYQNLYQEIGRKYEDIRRDDRLAVIVSHPHGCSKQVTVGEWVHRLQCLNEYHTTYLYDANTCPGCSGAPVFLLGRCGWWMTGHPHSGQSPEPGLNVSGGGVDY